MNTITMDKAINDARDDLIEAQAKTIEKLSNKPRQKNKWCKHIEIHLWQWRMAGGDWKGIPIKWKFCPFCGSPRPRLERRKLVAQLGKDYP